ncbi:hypothetical protein KKF05_04945 [Patescibacteria group bacterium]|nr:hypothetical protein [Patescibacteria group bacterium]MBU1915984.1 hypothetical protein [Patescibacteria group bacterium]
MNRSLTYIGTLLILWLTACAHHSGAVNGQSPLPNINQRVAPMPVRIPAGFQVSVPAGWHFSPEGRGSRPTLEGPGGTRVILQVVPTAGHTPQSVVDYFFHEQLGEMVQDQTLEILRVASLPIETGDLHYLETRSTRWNDSYTTIYACRTLDENYLLTGIGIWPSNHNAGLLRQMADIMASVHITEQLQ